MLRAVFFTSIAASLIVGLSGCSLVTMAPTLLLALASATALVISACSPTSPGRDAGLDAGGPTPESCCVGGNLSVCYCPVGTLCNYGAFVTCDDGAHCETHPFGLLLRCSTDDAGPMDAGVDLGPPVAQPCCVGDFNPVVSVCYCDPGVACNYGAFVTCDDGVHCSLSPGAPCVTDAGDDAASDASVVD